MGTVHDESLSNPFDEYDCSAWADVLFLGAMNPCRFDILLSYLDVVSLCRLSLSSQNLKSMCSLLKVYCHSAGRKDPMVTACRRLARLDPMATACRLLRWLRFTPVSELLPLRSQARPCPRLDRPWFTRLVPSCQAVIFHHFESHFDLRCLRALQRYPFIEVAFHSSIDLPPRDTFTSYRIELPRHTLPLPARAHLVWTSWHSGELCLSMWEWPLNASLPPAVRNILIHAGLKQIDPVLVCNLSGVVDITYRCGSSSGSHGPSSSSASSTRLDSDLQDEFVTLRMRDCVADTMHGFFGLAALLTKELATKYRYVE
jgi:hypothetical protein